MINYKNKNQFFYNLKMSTYVISQCQDLKSSNDLNRENFHRMLSLNKKKKLTSSGNNLYIVTNNTPKLKRTKTNGLSEVSCDSIKSRND